MASVFADNLLRHPVGFAQASVAPQAVSGGRFEAGLGAGWLRSELERTGRPLPDAGERVARYVETLTIVRSLLHHRRCQLSDQWYQADVDQLGPDVAAPPLVGALGGPRTIWECAPLLDRAEIKLRESSLATGPSTSPRSGGLAVARPGAHRWSPQGPPRPRAVSVRTVQGRRGRRDESVQPAVRPRLVLRPLRRAGGARRAGHEPPRWSRDRSGSR